MNRRFALLTLIALPLGGCIGPATTGSVRTDLRPSEAYTLATGDKLRVIVFGQDQLSNIYQVDGSGRITMPLVGSVPVAGLTTADASGAIEKRLRNGYIREPKVTVEIDAYRPFFILGEVTTSGQFPFVNGMTAQTAVAIAGGFTARAERKTVEISRRTSRGLVTAEVPVEYAVRPGDTITVKERWF